MGAKHEKQTGTSISPAQTLLPYMDARWFHCWAHTTRWDWSLSLLRWDWMPCFQTLRLLLCVTAVIFKCLNDCIWNIMECCHMFENFILENLNFAFDHFLHSFIAWYHRYIQYKDFRTCYKGVICYVQKTPQFWYWRFTKIVKIYNAFTPLPLYTCTAFYCSVYLFVKLLINVYDI